MAIVILQIGFGNYYKETQKVNAWVNDKQVTWTKGADGLYNGDFITQTSKRNNTILFLARCECVAGDVIKLKTEIFIRGMGFDEERSRIIEWLVDENIEPVDFSIKRVGDAHFPLVSGKVSLIHSRSRIEDRRERGEFLIQESKE